MNRTKRIARWLRLVFISKEITDETITDLWLIPFFNTTLKEVDDTNLYDGTREFYRAHVVKRWKDKAWYGVVVYVIRRQSVKWFWERRFPFFSRYKKSRRLAKKNMMWIAMSYGPGIELKD